MTTTTALLPLAERTSRSHPARTAANPLVSSGPRLLKPAAALLVLASIAPAQTPAPQPCRDERAQAGAGLAAKLKFADCLAAVPGVDLNRAIEVYTELSQSADTAYRFAALNNWASATMKDRPAEAWKAAQQISLPQPAKVSADLAGQLSRLGAVNLIQLRLTKARAAYFSGNLELAVPLYREALEDGLDPGNFAVEVGFVTARAEPEMDEDPWNREIAAITDAILTRAGTSAALSFLLETRDRLEEDSDREPINACLVRVLAQNTPSPARFAATYEPRLRASLAAGKPDIIADILTAFLAGPPLAWAGIRDDHPFWKPRGSLEQWFPSVVERQRMTRQETPRPKDIRRAIRKSRKATRERDLRWASRTIEYFSVLIQHIGEQSLALKQRDTAFAYFTLAWYVSPANTESALAAATIAGSGLDAHGHFGATLATAYNPGGSIDFIGRALTFRPQRFVRWDSAGDAGNAAAALRALGRTGEADRITKLAKSMRDDAPNCPANSIVCPPVEGSTAVEVRADLPSPTLVEIEVVARCSGEPGPVRGLALMNSGKSSAMVRLPERLSAGDQINTKLLLSSGDQNLGAVYAQPPHDAERLRLYTRVGVEVFPPGVRSFSGYHLNAHLGLTADYTFGTRRMLSPDRCGEIASMGFHSYVEARIDSISSTAVNAAAAAHAGYRAGDRETVATSPRLGPVFEAGFWLPFTLQRSSWKYKGSTLALFAAPIVKTGLQGRFESPPPPGSSGSLGSLGQDPLGPELRAGPHWYGAGGARIGYMRHFPKYQHVEIENAPVLTGYADFVVGKWNNFSLPALLDSDGRIVRRAAVPFRNELRSYFSIPGINVYFGVVYNFGHGPDDVRWFFGHRYELGTLSRKVQRLIASHR